MQWKKQNKGYYVSFWGKKLDRKIERFELEIVPNNAAYVYGIDYENCILLSEVIPTQVDVVLVKVTKMVKDHLKQKQKLLRRSVNHR